MLLLKYILLGIVQGIFEWIPISSQGILALISQSLDIALFLHVGTLLAVIIYFRQEFKNSKTIKFLVISTPISLAIGFVLYQVIQNIAIGNSLLILTGIGLLITSYFNKKKIKLNINNNLLAIIAGVLQGLAVIPGLSRSGATIFGLSLAKKNPEEILKISYVMSAPVVLASSFYLFLKNPSLAFDAWPALIASFVVGLAGLHFLLKYIKKINFAKFALIFAILCFIGAGVAIIF